LGGKGGKGREHGHALSTEKKVGGKREKTMVRTAELVGDELVGRLDPPHVLHVAVQGEQVLLILAEKYGEGRFRKIQGETCPVFVFSFLVLSFAFRTLSLY
jgi:hypothetical protein